MFSGSRRQPTDSELQREFETRNANLKSTVNETAGDIKSTFNQATDTLGPNAQAATQSIEQSTQSIGYKKRGSFSERFRRSSINSARRDMASLHTLSADAFESLAARNDDTFAQNALSEEF